MRLKLSVWGGEVKVNNLCLCLCIEYLVIFF